MIVERLLLAAGGLDPEQALDLVPDRKAEQRQDSGQEDERGPEAKLRVLALALTACADVPFRTFEPVRTRDRRRVDRGRGVRPRLTASRLGHEVGV